MKSDFHRTSIRAAKLSTQNAACMEVSLPSGALRLLGAVVLYSTVCLVNSLLNDILKKFYLHFVFLVQQCCTAGF